MPVVRALAVGLSVLTLSCPAAQAATTSVPAANAVPAVPWARITAPNGKNTDQVSAVRTPDGPSTSYGSPAVPVRQRTYIRPYCLRQAG